MNYQSENTNELFTALAKAQGEMSAASKDCKGYNYKYADLASVWGACREPLSKNGLSVTQIETQNETGDVLITILGHSSGQWIRSIMPIRIKAGGKVNELQEMGSVLTYLRRYALSAIVGIAPAEDDDGGNGGGYKASNQEVKPQPATQSTIKMVTPSQVQHLEARVQECSTEFKTKLADFMAKNNLKSYNDFSEHTFMTVFQSAIEDSKMQAKEAIQ